MSPDEIDVLVVGGGPAGMAAGISFGRAGLRTLVCERGSLPADKPCGEGVMPTGLQCLERLGVSAYLDQDHTRHFTGIHYLPTSERAQPPGLPKGRAGVFAAPSSPVRSVNAPE